MRFAGSGLRIRGLWTLLLISPAALAQPAPPGAGRDAARRGACLLPDDAVVVVTLRDGAERLGDLRRSGVMKSYLDSDAYAALASQPKFLQAQGALMLLAGTAGLDAWAAVGSLLGREVTVAISAPGDGSGPVVLATLLPADKPAAARLVDSLLAMAGATRGGEPDPARSREVAGVRGYELSKEAYVAWVDDVLAFSNRASALERLVRGRGETGGKLAASRLYEEAARSIPAGAVAWGFIDLKRIRGPEHSVLDRKLDNALGALLVGGWAEAIRKADCAVLWVEGGVDRLTVSGRLIGGGGDEKLLAPFVVATEEARDWSKLDVPGLLGGIRLERGWAELWDVREALIDADGLRGLTQFAGTLTTLMGGLDFSGELLPGLRPTLRFLAARQEFGGKPPTPELPAFALLLQLKDPGKLGPRLEQAALMALSIMNVDMGQKMQPQFVLSPELHEGTRILVGTYPEALDPGPRGIRYNFQPAVAVAGDQFVVATSKKLLTDIIDALGKLPARGGGESEGDALTVDLRRLHAVFAANREVFITQRMIAEDVGREEAARQVSLFLDAARLLSKLSLHVRRGAGGLSVEARLEFGGNP